MENADARRVRTCHINGKICVDGIREDFELDKVTNRPLTCRQWIHILGKDPQTEKTLDQYDCSFSWVPYLIIENAQESRQTGASVDKVANQVADVKLGITAMSGAVRVAAASIAQAVESGALTVMLPPPNGSAESNGHDKAS